MQTTAQGPVAALELIKNLGTTGLYSRVFEVLVAVFINGLMVGRSPEHLGRRIRPTETKLIAFYTLLGPATVLVLTALALLTQAGQAGLTTNTGSHGFTEIFFAYASALANNGKTWRDRVPTAFSTTSRRLSPCWVLGSPRQKEAVGSKPLTLDTSPPLCARFTRNVGCHKFFLTLCPTIAQYLIHSPRL